MGPWVREADDEEEDNDQGGRLRRVAGKRGVLVRQQRSLESTLVGELARGAIVELATDAVEGAARVRISAPLEGLGHGPLARASIITGGAIDSAAIPSDGGRRPRA